MTTTPATTRAPTSRMIQGGAFLIEPCPPDEVFTPEDLTDQHQLIAQTAREFVSKEVIPRISELEDPAKKHTLSRQLLGKAAELGLTAAEIPETYGGLGLDKMSTLVIAEEMAAQGSFSSTFGTQVGIGSLPIVFFGTEQQKTQYLPRLAAAEMVGAYCLSEATSASDAMNARTKATLSPDGSHYLLNGTKMWITNGGFADLFTVFAKIDGEKFTAFLVERSTPGLTVGAEEKKMGIRGSSTAPLVLEDARVPAANVLGEIGKGHRIAFNILNFGRLKLGASCVAACRELIEESVKWAKERVAFGRPIADYGLIKEKLGEMIVRAYSGRSMAYRTMGMIESLSEVPDSDSPGPSAKILEVMQEHAVECSIMKVFGAETLDFVVDQAVQIHGGYGYSAEYRVEQAYRDSRINRIFEGTDEINRLLLVNMLLKRSLNGELGLIPAAKNLLEETLTAASALPETGDSGQPLAVEAHLVEGARKAVLLVAGSTVERYQKALSEEQEIIGALANMVIEVYAMESCLLRTLKNIRRKGGNIGGGQEIGCDATRAAVCQGLDRVEAEGRRALARIGEGDTRRIQLSLLRKFLKRTPVDVIALKRRVADRAIELGRYPFSARA